MSAPGEKKKPELTPAEYYDRGWVDGIGAALEVLESLSDLAETEGNDRALSALREAREHVESLAEDGA